MRKFQGMLLDINNNCNIRCKFCINEWSKVGKTVYMESKTFDKALSLLPLVSRGFMSCSAESTIHPDFIELFKKIPRNTGAYTFITTNLSRYLSDEEIEDISNLKLDAISISIGSLKAEVYEELHAGSKFSTFISNLDRLSGVCKQKANAPRLRFITVALKQNIGDLEYMAKTCFEDYDPLMHQFRTPFTYTIKIKKKDWLDRSIPSREEWNRVSGALGKLHCGDIQFFNPLYPEPSKPGKKKVNTYFSFRADGKIEFHDKKYDMIDEGLPIEFRKDFNINDIEKPYEFFKEGLAKI